MLDESTLHLIGDGEGRYEVFTRCVYQFSACEHRAEIIRRVARLAFRQEIVHEVQVPHERGIEEGRAVRCCLSPSDARGSLASAKFIDVTTYRRKRTLSDRAKCAAKGIQNPNFEQLEGPG